MTPVERTVDGSGQREPWWWARHLESCARASWRWAKPGLRGQRMPARRVPLTVAVAAMAAVVGWARWSTSVPRDPRGTIFVLEFAAAAAVAAVWIVAEARRPAQVASGAVCGALFAGLVGGVLATAAAPAVGSDPVRAAPLDPWYGGLLFSVLFPAIVEEAVFRGALLVALQRRWQTLRWRSHQLGGPAALIVSSIAFSAAHRATGIYSHDGIASTFGAGLVLGAVFMLTGSLLAVILAHGLGDGSATLVQYHHTAIATALGTALALAVIAVLAVAGSRHVSANSGIPAAPAGP